MPRVKAELLDGKRGLIVGIANEHSIAWDCAKAFRAFGAELAVTYLNDKARKYVEPLAQTIEARMLLPLDVNIEGEMEAVFQRLTKEWGQARFPRAKAPLESAVRYVAAELGPKGIRVHAISPGPLQTRAASGIPEFDELLDKARVMAPARRLVNIDDVGVTTAFLVHDAARLITGETLYVDGKYHIID